MTSARLRLSTAAATALLLAGGSVWSAAGAVTAAGQAAKVRSKACTDVHVPCTFSTPDGNIRCRWRPTPDSVACEILSSGRAFRLFPKGHAKAIHLSRLPRGQRLPANHDLVFPQALSCTSSGTAMTCNQDFGTGGFKLSRKGSRGF